MVGGPARRRVVLLLGAVLSLQSADAGTVGAVAPQLETAFRIGNTQLGLLITVSTLVGAVAALPMGVVADRTRRARTLAIAVLLWSGGMAATGLATSYLMVLVTRLALGAVTAAAGPIVASLVGDLFPAKERSRIYGMVLTGELVGGGAGLVLSAEISGFAGWRVPFFVLTAPSLVVAYSLRRWLPEPARGGQSWLRAGDEEITPAEAVGQNPDGTLTEAAAQGSSHVPAPPVEDSEVRRRARARRDIQPRPGLVLQRDPLKMAPWAAATYVLRIPSNLVLIASSVLGYFFVAGLRSFVVLFVESHYKVSQAAVPLMLVPVGAGAIAGTLAGGRLVDTLVRKGRIDARITVSAFAFMGCALLFLPGLASTSVLLSVPFYALAAGLLTTPNPALDAARLDVVPSRLWGRGEAVRTFGQSVLEAFAPLVFGYVSSRFGGPSGSLGPSVGPRQVAPVSAAQGRGLEYTFIIMLGPLLAAGALLMASRRAYLRDVATADVSDHKLYKVAVGSVGRVGGVAATPAPSERA